MTHSPHPDSQPIAVTCAVITVSDTRTPQTDRSGQMIQTLLRQAEHEIADYHLLPDQPDQIQTCLQQLNQRSEIEAIILSGGTGIAPRDTTYDAIEQRLDKVLPGFGELFRFLSYQEIGSRAIASRAVAGVCGSQLIFSLPGSTNAVKLAMEKLILPELGHLVRLLRPQKTET